MTPPILPLFKGEDGWYIDSSELTPDCPEWGPYPTKVEANEDRRPSFIRLVRALRKQKAKEGKKCQKQT